MADTGIGGHVDGFGATKRTDNWWVGPAVTAGMLSLWLLYYFWAAAQGKHYSAGPYVSPFYITYQEPASVTDTSPVHALWGYWPASWPWFLTPALIIGFLPGTFRLTCYYYRKAYYRAFFGMPPGCAVGTRKVRYEGETALLVFQNLHRYTLYIAILMLPLLYLDAINGLMWHGQFGIGLGTIVLFVNAILITSYTLGCHAWRHLIGGKLNCFSCDGASELRHTGWMRSTWFNARHQQFAWTSLIWIAFSDLYIRAVSMGGLPDINTWSGVTWIGQFHWARKDSTMALDISEIQTIEHDVIVVGAGGAGLRAAIECSHQGLSTGLVCKSLLGKAHTVMAEGGAAAAMGNVDSRDNWKVHFRDTMRGGKFLNVWRMAELHAKEAPDRIRELEEWGAVFDRTPEGKINQRNFGGHRYPRLAHVGDRTGLELIRTLQDKGVHSGITVHMECTGLGLLLDSGRVAGMVGYWRDSGRFVIYRAKAVILATGGFGKAWKITSNSWEYTGDGQRMAYDVGAELLDMEFTQFHPTGMVWPPSVAGVLVTEGVRGEGGILRNKDGKRFMFGYIPEKFAAETADSEEEAQRWLNGDKNARRPPELLTRDEVARSIHNEVKQGRGSPHGGVFLDISHRDAEYVKRKLPSMYHQFKELAEVDITKDAMEVGPTLHYAMGGVRVDAESQMTRVPGLFACGEVGAGLHGANRLGGNSLSDLLVFGRRAGLGAKAFIDEHRGMPAMDDNQVKALIAEAKAPLMRESGENPYVVHDELRESMTRNVGIWRDADGMKQGIADIATLRERARNVKVGGTSQYNPGWSEAIDLESLFVCAEATARAGLMREESRGAHSREDFMGEREDWSKVNIVVRKGSDGQMEVEKVVRPPPPPELEKIAKASIEDLEKGNV